jgi:hypothetical protein
MTARRILPNRRACETFSFSWLGMGFVATISRFDDGGLAEIFLSNGKVNSQADTAARDAAVVASLALQHGVPVDGLRKALLRDAHGIANGPLGIALDMIAAMDGRIQC